MAEDKKPKIDLKARLGKPAIAGAVPGAPLASPSGRPIPAPAGSVPAPPGVPVGTPFSQSPPDQANPLAAAASYRAPAPVAAAPQIIEIDEGAVNEARKAAQKKGMIIGLLFAVVTGAIGYFAGTGSEQTKGRERSVSDAQDLAKKLEESEGKLKTLAEKLEAGRAVLGKQQFPADLAKDLGAINIDFDGAQLGGRRFSGVSTDTTRGLVEFITAVQSLNDRKTLISGLLTKVQKPLTEGGAKAGISQVVVIEKSPTNGPFATLASLMKPIPFVADKKIDLPSDFVVTGNRSVPRYVSGDISAKIGAVWMPPDNSEVAGQAAQLAAQIGNVLREINGEKAAQGGDAVTETKPGMVERAELLAKALKNVK